MRSVELQRKETLLIEALMSGLEVREAAKAAGVPMLLYLAELVVQCTRGELAEVRALLEASEDETRRSSDRSEPR